MEEWRYSFTILDLGIRWRWVVSFTLQPLYPPGKSPRCPLDRMLQSRSGLCGEERNLYPCRKSNPSHPAHSPSRNEKYKITHSYETRNYVLIYALIDRRQQDKIILKWMIASVPLIQNIMCSQFLSGSNFDSLLLFPNILTFHNMQIYATFTDFQSVWSVSNYSNIHYI
jgi:hypothetical protein